MPALGEAWHLQVERRWPDATRWSRCRMGEPGRRCWLRPSECLTPREVVREPAGPAIVASISGHDRGCDRLHTRGATQPKESEMPAGLTDAAPCVPHPGTIWERCSTVRRRPSRTRSRHPGLVGALPRTRSRFTVAGPRLIRPLGLRGRSPATSRRSVRTPARCSGSSASVTASCSTASGAFLAHTWRTSRRETAGKLGGELGGQKG